MNKRLVVIDGNAILHRAYHALPSLTNKNGEPINAVYGFSSMLLRVINDLKPTHLVVAFDTPEPTFRNRLFKNYQAKRPQAEDNLISQIGKVHKLVSDFQIPSYKLPGYEADDIIGTISHKVSSLKNCETIIVTGDKDILQLVNTRTKVYLPVRGLTEGKLYGEEEVREKYSLNPEQIVDLKALTGDSSDNYPGVLGIGPKTAVLLLKHFKTLDGIYKAIGNKKLPVQLSNKVVSTLVSQKKEAYLCQKLATIVKNTPFNFRFDEASWHNDPVQIEKVLQNWGFRSLIKRINGEKEKTEKKEKADNQLGLFKS